MYKLEKTSTPNHICNIPVYPDVIDGLLNTNFSKQKIKLDQSVKNKVERACCPFLRQVRNNSRQKQKDSRQNRENYSDVEKYISKRHIS